MGPVGAVRTGRAPRPGKNARAPRSGAPRPKKQRSGRAGRAHEHLRRVLLGRDRLGALGMGGELVRGDFVERCASIKERVMRRHRRGRSIVPLDQLGWNAVPFAVVRDILTTIPKSEVILAFNVDWLIDHLAGSPETAKAVERLGMTHGGVQDLLIRKAQAGGRILAQQVLARRHPGRQLPAQGQAPRGHPAQAQ